MADTETNMEAVNIGVNLRQAREARGLSIEDVSSVLKIRGDHLKALENDDFDELPASVYAIGFIRTYATYLGLNAGELTNRYKAAVAVHSLEDEPYDPQAEREQVSLAVKSAIGVVAVFVMYILWLIAGGATGPEPVAAPNRAPEISSAKRTLSAEAQKPKVRVAAKPQAAKPQPAKTPKAVAAAPVPDPLRTPVVVEPIAALDAETTPGKIEIRAVRRTWLRIENTDGQVLLSSIVTEGDSFELSEEAPYTLATRDAGALKYVVDGETVGSVGRRSQILTARQIDRSSILTLKP